MDNAQFADVNWVDASASSVAEMVWDLVRELGPVTKACASNLYAGLLGDTGRFIYANTTEKALRVAADLAGAGARVAWVSESQRGK